jgi:hypothetical protein
VVVLSGLLQAVERHLQEAAGAGPWLVRFDHITALHSMHAC